ncbi:MAG: Crp/Fnr family transcriptional regulator [Dehalococcoidia bacterium]|nr:MAG: Crp/Fnr family transcriptional regulator [Dehalococcoidia bacterium]
MGYLTETDLFRGLDDAEMDEVAHMTTMTTCRAGRVFYTPGESGEVLFIIKKGSVQLYRIAPDGKRLVIGALRSGAVFGEMGLIGQGMYDSFAEASEDCTLCVMSRADVETLVASKPAFAIGLLELMGQRLQDVESSLERLAFRSVPSRLASLLLALRDANGEVRGLSHQNLADRIGTHRETATRALNDFRVAGIIELGRERVRIVDAIRLQALADEAGA